MVKMVNEAKQNKKYSTDLGGLAEERQVQKDDVRTLNTILSVCTSLKTRFMLIFYKIELECKN